MSGVALGLVLAAACIHATWNWLAKRAGGGAVFVWLFGALSTLLYAPLALAVLIAQRPRLGSVELLFIVGSGVIHVAYFLALQRGYLVGDLSVVYPLARGTGPTLSTLAAIMFFQERPTPLALCGALLVVAGVFFLSGGSGASGRMRLGAVGYGLLTGSLIAAYTLWDKQAVSALAIPPLLLDYGSNMCRAVLLAPLAFRRPDDVLSIWRAHRREALGVALLTPLSYILVLTALVTSPVSYVAPAREISIVIGTAMGTRLLAEGNAGRRLGGAAAIVVGVVALAFG
jgi:drug/metabolite transporter (DMT)-like permease